MKNKKYCVYKLESPEGKVYIGATSDLKHRWRGNGIGYNGSPLIEAAIKKWGWEGLKKTVIMDNLSENEAYALEREKIAEYKSNDECYGYNLESGGKTGKKMHKTSIEKVRKANMGHPVSKENRLKLSERTSIPIICIETKCTYKNAIEAADKLGLCASSIRKACKGKQGCCGGLHFALLEEYRKGNIPKFERKPSRWKKVICKTTGTIYENACDASRKTGFNRRGIAYACEGKYKQFMGAEWAYVDE